MKLRHNISHEQIRKAVYPTVGDQLDALWKLLEAIQTGQAPPESAQLVQQRIREVKIKYKKQESK